MYETLTYRHVYITLRGYNDLFPMLLSVLNYKMKKTIRSKNLNKFLTCYIIRYDPIIALTCYFIFSSRAVNIKKNRF